MPLDNKTFDQITYTDTFKQWADKCNELITSVNQTEILSTSNAVTISGDESVYGSKNWFAEQIFYNSVQTFSNTSFRGSAFKTTVNTGSFQIGSNLTSTETKFINSDIILQKSESDPEVTLTFTSGKNDELSLLGSSLNIENDLTAGSGSLTSSGLTIDGDLITFASGSSTPIFRVADIDWKLPIVQPTNRSLFTWDNQTDEIYWQPEQDLTDTISTAVQDTLNATQYTIPVQIIPVGSEIRVDASILDSWPQDVSSKYEEWSAFPGWRVPDGGQVSFDLNASPVDDKYETICKLLDPDLIGSDSGTVTLPNRYDTVEIISGLNDEDYGQIYLLKAAEENATEFSIKNINSTSGGNGITLLNNEQNPSNKIDILGGRIGLNIDESDFKFLPDGKLTHKREQTHEAIANTTVIRNANARFKANDPINNLHVVNLQTLNNQIDIVDEKLVEERRGGYVDSFGTFSNNWPSNKYMTSIPFLKTFNMITGQQDALYENGDYYRTVPLYKKKRRETLYYTIRLYSFRDVASSRDYQQAGLKPIQCISPLTNQRPKFKKIQQVSTKYIFSLDEDDIIYCDNNLNGVIGYPGTINPANDWTGINDTDFLQDHNWKLKDGGASGDYGDYVYPGNGFHVPAFVPNVTVNGEKITHVRIKSFTAGNSEVISRRTQLPSYLYQQNYFSSYGYDKVTRAWAWHDDDISKTPFGVHTKDGYGLDGTLNFDGDGTDNGVNNPTTRGFIILSGMRVYTSLTPWWSNLAKFNYALDQKSADHSSIGPRILNHRPNGYEDQSFAVKKPVPSHIFEPGGTRFGTGAGCDSFWIQFGDGINFESFNYYTPHHPDWDQPILTDLDGLNPKKPSDYPWYIKKHSAFNAADFILVGKPDDDSENELWIKGQQSICCMGAGFRDRDSAFRQDDLMDYNWVPVLGPLQNWSTSYLGIEFPFLGDGVFSNSWVSDLKDYDMFLIGNERWFVKTGDWDENQKKRTGNGFANDQKFRLFTNARYVGHFIRCQGPDPLNRYREFAKSSPILFGTTIRKAYILKGITDYFLNEMMWYARNVFVLTDNGDLYSWGTSYNGRDGTKSLAGSSGYTEEKMPNICMQDIDLSRGDNIYTFSGGFGAIVLKDGNIWFTGDADAFNISTKRILQDPEAGIQQHPGDITSTRQIWNFTKVLHPWGENKVKRLFVSNARKLSVYGDNEHLENLANAGNCFAVVQGDVDEELWVQGADLGHLGNLLRYETEVAGTNWADFGIDDTPDTFSSQGWKKILFPEPIENIVEIYSGEYTTYVLCKSNGDSTLKTGRVYGSGTILTKASGNQNVNCDIGWTRVDGILKTLTEQLANSN